MGTWEDYDFICLDRYQQYMMKQKYNVSFQRYNILLHGNVSMVQFICPYIFHWDWMRIPMDGNRSSIQYLSPVVCSV